MIKQSIFNTANTGIIAFGLYFYHFLHRWVCMAALIGLFSINAHAAGKIQVHTCPLAGAQFHALGQLREQMQVGDELRLIREPNNKHDPLAIRVEWQGQMLGYVPRADNPPLAAVMDQGHHLTASIAALRNTNNPWQRMEIHLYLRWD